jgi:hypothetical protein
MLISDQGVLVSIYVLSHMSLVVQGGLNRGVRSEDKIWDEESYSLNAEEYTPTTATLDEY